MKKIITMLLALTMLLTVAAVPALADGEKVLNAAYIADISTMDVALTTNDYIVALNVFDRLYEVKVQPDGSTEIVPSLAESYEVSEDGLTYTFKLVEGVTFSNGNPLTASDVKYTFERLLTIPEGVNYDIALEFAGAEDLLNGDVDTLDSLAVNGDYEISMTLAAPNAGFVAELTSPAMSIVDEETCESVSGFGVDPADTIGSGPYIISEWAVNDHLTFTRNENYWGEQPDVDTCILHIVPDAGTQNLMFQSGELDIVDLDNLDASIIESTYQTIYADSIVSGPRVGVTFITMNENNEFLSDVNVRKAVQMAIDRQGIVDAFFAGNAHVENGMIAGGVWGHNDDLTPITYDPEGAKELLAKAGYEEGEITFEFSYDNSSGTTKQSIVQKIVQDLAAVGINAEFKSYEYSAWLDFRRTEEMPMFLGTWTMDFNDPANVLGTFFSPSTAGRSMNYANTAIAERVDAAKSIMDDDERMAEYQALEEAIVVEDAAVVPLYEEMHMYAIGERVESFIPHWAGYTDFYIRDVVMK